MNTSPYLSDQELFELTEYKAARKQIEVLQRLGIHHVLLRDRTVRVMRMDCFSRTQTNTKKPQLRL